MNKKFISAMLLSALAVSCMTGCGENAENENSVSDSVSKESSVSDSVSAENSDGEMDLDAEIASLEQQAMESAENQPTSAVSATAEPLQEILDADFSSGLIQIGNDIFKNGGYMTINEFIAEYGDKYDTSEIDVSKSVFDGWIHQYAITNNETEKNISLICKQPVDINGTVGDAVIIYFRPSGATDVWYPTGISMMEKPAEMTIDDINKIYEDNGYTFVDTTSAKDSKTAYRNFNTAENAGKYTVINLHENNTSSITCQMLAEPNLYGVNPMIISSFENTAFDGKEPYNYFYYRDLYYADGTYESFLD